MKNIIEVNEIRKVYRTHERDSGVASAIKSLFYRKYIDKVAVNNISFEVKEGEILGLVGPNGAGKSTMIKMLCGVLYPTSGKIISNGFIPWDQREKYVKDIGVVFGQKEQLWWDIPAVDSFYLAKDLYDIPEKEFSERLNYMLDLLDLKEVSKIPVKDLSLGERMKCKLVMSLLHNPKVIFLDEPTIGLDIIAKERLRDFILDYNKKNNTTFIITTHDMQDIERLCKRIIIINHGKIVYDGLLEQIKEKFVKYKRFNITFENKITNFSFKHVKIIKKQEYEIDIELNIKEVPIKKLINYLLENFDILDINISDPPIEDIIKIIYQEK